LPIQYVSNQNDEIKTRYEGEENGPSGALARPQRVPSLLSQYELREFGGSEVVYGREADGGDEEGVEVVGEAQG